MGIRQTLDPFTRRLMICGYCKDQKALIRKVHRGRWYLECVNCANKWAEDDIRQGKATNIGFIGDT